MTHGFTPYKDDFLNQVSEFLKPNHSQGTALLRFVKSKADRWHINDVDPLEVVIEATKRGCEYIEKHQQPINNPAAWVRGTCLNILRDRVRQSIKAEKCFQDLVLSWKDQSYEANPLFQVELFDQLHTIQTALDSLSAQDRELLVWRFYEGKSYKEIRELLKRRDGDCTIQEPTLRKRESRALKKLRNSFLRLYSI
jgi:RNA polymerase sigma factor (sigma-70 family)